MDGVLFLLMDHLVILVECIFLFAFADMFLYRKWRGALPLLPAMMLCWIVQYLLNISFLGPFKILLSLAVDAACLLIYYSGSLLKRLFLLASFYTFLSLTQSIAIAVLYRRHGGAVDDLHADPVLAWGAYVISLLLTMLCLLFCERFRRVETVPLSARSWACLLAVPTASIAFVWLFFPFGRASADADALRLIAGLSVVLLGFNLFVFFFYRSIAKSTAALCRYEDLKRYCEHLGSLLQSEEQRRDIIHDYLHNLGVIVALIEGGQPREAADYIYRLEQRIKQVRAEKYTGNREVDAILACKIPMMQQHGIKCKVEGVLPPTLPFDFLDVCALLSNALDNAVEACVEQGISGQVVGLHVSFHNGFFRMRVSNPLGDQVRPKKKAPGRGRGLLIMRAVVDKYEGVLAVTTSDGVFVLSALLQSPSQ